MGVKCTPQRACARTHTDTRKRTLVVRERRRVTRMIVLLQLADDWFDTHIHTDKHAYTHARGGASIDSLSLSHRARCNWRCVRREETF